MCKIFEMKMSGVRKPASVCSHLRLGARCRRLLHTKGSVRWFRDVVLYMRDGYWILKFGGFIESTLMISLNRSRSCLKFQLRIRSSFKTQLWVLFKNKLTHLLQHPTASSCPTWPERVIRSRYAFNGNYPGS